MTGPCGSCFRAQGTGRATAAVVRPAAPQRVQLVEVGSQLADCGVGVADVQRVEQGAPRCDHGVAAGGALEGLDNGVQRTPGTASPTTFRQWCEEVLKPAVLA